MDEAALTALLANAPSLAHLGTLRSLPGPQLPAAIRERHWEPVSLMREGLSDLPAGPYLQGESCKRAQLPEQRLQAC